MFSYNIEVVKIVDGYTVDVDIDLGFSLWLRDERIRLSGIDTPESRTSDPVEKIFGNLAKDYVNEFFSFEGEIIMISKEFKKGKYGRIIADFRREGSEFTLCEELLRENLAVIYTGQSKKLVEDDHLRNREILIAKSKII